MSTPARTTADAVQAVLGSGSPVSNWDGQTDLTPYIQTASALVDQVITFNAQGMSTLGVVLPISTVVAELIERWLSAYFYCKMDPIYAQKTTAGASATFAKNASTLDNEGDRYKRAALELDPTGILNALLNRKVAGSQWLGSCPPPPRGVGPWW